MIVRSARGTDWPRLFQLIKDAHRRSNIAAFTLDVRICKEHCLTLMMANVRKPIDGAAHIFVAEHLGELHGFVIPAATRLYVWGVDLIVSDLMFYVREGGEITAATKLWNAVENWAAVPEVMAIRPATSNAIEDPERTAKFYEHRGYTRIGVMLEKRKPAIAAARRVA